MNSRRRGDYSDRLLGPEEIAEKKFVSPLNLAKEVCPNPEVAGTRIWEISKSTGHSHWYLANIDVDEDGSYEKGYQLCNVTLVWSEKSAPQILRKSCSQSAHPRIDSDTVGQPGSYSLYDIVDINLDGKDEVILQGGTMYGGEAVAYKIERGKWTEVLKGCEYSD